MFAVAGDGREQFDANNSLSPLLTSVLQRLYQ